MRIRNGFVSNSSSTSFVLVHEDVPQPDSKSLAKVLKEHIERNDIDNLWCECYGVDGEVLLKITEEVAQYITDSEVLENKYFTDRIRALKRVHYIAPRHVTLDGYLPGTLGWFRKLNKVYKHLPGQCVVEMPYFIDNSFEPSRKEGALALLQKYVERVTW